jgi:hypothetical protein
MTKRRADAWADTAEDILGDGGRRAPAAKTKPEASTGSAPLSPRIRKAGASATSPSGEYLRRTVYVTEAEWRAVLETAIREDVTAAEIVRRALRAYLRP